MPADIQVMIGSQWWCLRRQTIEKVLEFCAARPDVLRDHKARITPPLDLAGFHAEWVEACGMTPARVLREGAA